MFPNSVRKVSSTYKQLMHPMAINSDHGLGWDFSLLARESGKQDPFFLLQSACMSLCEWIAHKGCKMRGPFFADISSTGVDGSYNPEEWPFMWLRVPPTKRKNHGQLRFVKAGKRFDGHLRFVKRKSTLFKHYYWLTYILSGLQWTM